MSITSEQVRALEEAYAKASFAFLDKVPIIDGQRRELRGAKAAYRRLVAADRAYREAVAAQRTQEEARR
jgi:hypothetical protein